MIATVEHNVVHKKTGNVVGIIESCWDTLFPGEYTLDGYPAGGVLVRRTTYGSVPAGILRIFDGSPRDGDEMSMRAYTITPRFAH